MNSGYGTRQADLGLVRAKAGQLAINEYTSESRLLCRRY